MPCLKTKETMSTYIIRLSSSLLVFFATYYYYIIVKHQEDFFFFFWMLNAFSISVRVGWCQEGMRKDLLEREKNDTS